MKTEIKAVKMFISVIICKALYFIGKLVGKGSSLPGKIVLKLFPDILGRVKLPEIVIAVSGSNGKTSTVEMIAHILQSHGKSVIWNKEGSNQIEGVTTFLLCACSFSGRVKADIVLLETDERYARHTFKFFSPTHFVITNLYRDQMTRNAHSEWIYDIICDAIKPTSQLILNADDPLVSKFGIGRDNNVYFSMDKNKYSEDEARGTYNDGYYCPVCRAKLNYEYYNMAHIGKYSCPSCLHKTNNALCKVTDMDLDTKTVVFDGCHEIKLAFASQFNVYNLLAAFTLSAVLKLDKTKTAEALNSYILKSGRIVSYKIGEHKGLLLTSKHENSVSYNQSLDYIARQGKACNVTVLVDAISRKYYTSETSWLFDIDFNMLNKDFVKNIILTGKYAYDLAVRFEFTEIPKDKIKVIPDISEAVSFMNTDDSNYLYTVTCFSDKDKLLSRVSPLEDN